MVGRVSYVRSQTMLSPFLSANDRSRAMTIRALGDFNTYRIDEVTEPLRDWHTIDKVRHKGRDGKLHYYSSKPTLLPTLMAYEYLAIKSITGKEIREDPFSVTQIILITFNVIPVLIIVLIIAALAERFCESDWAKIFVVACACFGTYLFTFSVTLNNHIPAALGAAVGIFALVRIWVDDSRTLLMFFLAGLGSAWTAANELPALSFLAVALTAASIKSLPKTVVGFLPGVALVVVPFFLTNRIAHDDWKPAYTHRNDGEIVGKIHAELEQQLPKQVEVKQAKGVVLQLPHIMNPDVRKAINDQAGSIGFELGNQSVVNVGQMPKKKSVEQRWMVFDPATDNLLAISKEDNKLLLREWNNWYEYYEFEWRNGYPVITSVSYWLKGVKSGVDKGEPDIGNYAFHVLIGHHGIFSLTPIWIISVLGFLIVLFGWAPENSKELFWVYIALFIISAVVVTFYIVRPMEDRNYGGLTCALRWLLWLAPFWLLMLIPAADLISKNILLKIIAVVLLLASAWAFNPLLLNPWSQPWLYDLMVTQGWVEPF